MLSSISQRFLLEELVSAIRLEMFELLVRSSLRKLALALLAANLVWLASADAQRQASNQEAITVALIPDGLAADEEFVVGEEGDGVGEVGVGGAEEDGFGTPGDGEGGDEGLLALGRGAG